MKHQVVSRQRDPLLWLCIVGAAVLYGALSIAAYMGYNSGMLDLGNMSQAFWNTLHGNILEYTHPSGNASRLVGHAEIIYLLLAPLYALWPDPRTLLIIQAALMALGAWPVYHLALRRLSSRAAARSFALAYLLYPTAVSAVLFDFHGDTLAMPLLLFALDALDRRAWRSYAVFIALALLCKVYIAAPVALLGLTLLDPRRAPYPAEGLLPGRRLGPLHLSWAGLLTGAAAVVYGAFIFFVLRALLTSGSISVAQSSGYVSYYYSGAIDNIPARVIAVAAVLLPTALLSPWAPLALLPAFGIIIPTALSTGPAASYDFRYHHYAAAVPFIIASAIIGAQRRAQARRARRPVEASALLALVLVLVLHVAFNDTPLGITFWQAAPGYGLDASGYGRTPRDSLKDRWLAQHVPSERPIAASNFLATHLTNRRVLYLLRYPTEQEPNVLHSNLDKLELIVADALLDYYVQLPEGYGGGINGEAKAIAVALYSRDFALVEERDGLLLFKRGVDPAQELYQQAVQMQHPPAPARRLALAFGDAVELVGYNIEHLGDRRYRLELHWRALRPFLPGERYVAVSKLQGPQGELLRYPHLGTMALLPTDQWTPGMTIVETRTIALPEDAAPGSYRWSIGWYNPAHPRAAWSEPAALIAGSTEHMITHLDAPAP